MTLYKLRGLISKYQQDLEKVGFKPAQYPAKQIFGHSGNAELGYGEHQAATKHILYMLNQLEGFVDEGRIEKAMRWLGFVQGILWIEGFYSIEDLKEHNKPDRPAG